MYFSRIQPHPHASARELFEMGQQALSAGNKEGYKVHQHIWALMAGAEKRDFLYRLHQDGAGALFYLVSQHPPRDGRGLWLIDTKPYQPDLPAGTRLSFMLRVNPVVTRHLPGADGQPQRRRHDVVMDEKKRLEREGVSKNDWPSTTELVQQAGVAWLEKRALSQGFALEKGWVRAEGYQRHRFWQPKNKDFISLSTLDFTGVLTVTEPTAFGKTLLGGIGPAKGFGCGLLLVRKV